MTLHLTTIKGQDLIDALPDLARLRIEIFEDYPYLYDGTFEYEEKYLIGLTQRKDSIIVAVRDSGKTIGCATGSALAGHYDEFVKPFRNNGYDINQIFYCGELVLQREYRGRGLGNSFFDQREAHARSLGYRFSTFCGVIRPQDHPLKPSNYRPLDEFWGKRGYSRVDGLTGSSNGRTSIRHKRQTT